MYLENNKGLAIYLSKITINLKNELGFAIVGRKQMDGHQNYMKIFQKFLEAMKEIEEQKLLCCNSIITPSMGINFITRAESEKKATTLYRLEIICLYSIISKNIGQIKKVF